MLRIPAIDDPEISKNDLSTLCITWQNFSILNEAQYRKYPQIWAEVTDVRSTIMYSRYP